MPPDLTPALTPYAAAAHHVRWMIRRDLPEVVAIERVCFPDSAWSEEQFLALMRLRTVVGMCAEGCGQRPVGYAVYELRRRSVLLLNLAVAPASGGRGVGSLLVAKLLHKVRSLGRGVLAAEVYESNTDLQLWLRGRGFRCVGITPGYRPDRGEDPARYGRLVEDRYVMEARP